METVPVRFDVLHAYAEAHLLDYNELCRMVRDAIGESPLEPLKELAGEGSTVLVSSWVYQGEVTGWKVLARGMDGWRKAGQGETMEAALAAAQAADWHSPAQGQNLCPICGNETPCHCNEMEGQG